jgi:hypothetical protein
MDDRDCLAITFGILIGVVLTGLIMVNETTSDTKVADGDLIIIKHSSYKCKMVKTLKE